MDILWWFRFEAQSSIWPSGIRCLKQTKSNKISDFVKTVSVHWLLAQLSLAQVVGCKTFFELMANQPWRRLIHSFGKNICIDSFSEFRLQIMNLTWSNLLLSRQTAASQLCMENRNKYLHKVYIITYAIIWYYFFYVQIDIYLALHEVKCLFLWGWAWDLSAIFKVKWMRSKFF